MSDYIRQHYGQTALHALSQTQLETILHLLQHGQLSIPQPQQRPPTLRPLLPAEHNTLNQLVTKLAAATGEPSKLIWQSMLELCGVKSGELIPATHFLPLSYWLQARQTLSAQSAPTLTSLQGALKQPLEAAEWQTIVDFARRSWQVTPRTTLSPAQILALLKGLQEKHRLAYIFISHDLHVVRALCHQVIVLRQGEVVEQGQCEHVFNAPQQAYTRQLLALS